MRQSGLSARAKTKCRRDETGDHCGPGSGVRRRVLTEQHADEPARGDGDTLLPVDGEDQIRRCFISR